MQLAKETKTRKAKLARIIPITIIIVMSLFLACLIANPLIEKYQLENTTSLQFITGYGEHWVWFTRPVDHDDRYLYGNYTVAEGVKVPAYFSDYWAQVTLHNGIVTDIKRTTYRTMEASSCIG